MDTAPTRRAPLPPGERRSHQASAAPTRRAPLPPGERRSHQAGTGPGMRRHGLRSTPTHPGSSPACGRPAPSGTRSDRAATPSRGRAPTAPFQDLTRATDPFQAPRPGRRRPCPRGCPEGGSKRRPSAEPRTVATERAQYGHPTVPALDLTSAIAQSRHGVKGAPPTKATPAPMPGVTVTGGAQPRGTVRVSGRSPAGAGRRSPATPPVRSTHPRAWARRHPDWEGSWPVGSSKIRAREPRPSTDPAAQTTS